MRPDSLQSAVVALAKAIEKAGLPKLARALDALVASRSPAEHAKWDQQKRKPASEVVVQSLEHQASKDEELTQEAQQLMLNLPQVEENISGINTKESELLPIEETDGLTTSRNHLTSRQPADILWSLVRLRSDEATVRAFFSRRIGIGNDRDWQQFKKRHIDPILSALRDAFGEAYSNAIWTIAAQASRVYGCHLEDLKPADVYTRAFEFYGDSGLGQTVTFATSSGLPNPLERHGTDWFLARYQVDRTSEAVADLLLKNPFRTDNFAKGILNDEIRCSRLYVWESRGTAGALKKAYAAVPKEKKDLFVTDAIARLAECLVLPQLRIVEVPTFERWMTRLTRNGPNSIMVSFRGALSKRISHAININFARAEEVDRILRLVLPIGGVIAEAAHPSVALGILWAAAIGIEATVYEELKKQVFTRGTDWPNGRIEGLHEVKPFGEIEAARATKIAEQTVHRMLT